MRAHVFFDPDLEQLQLAILPVKRDQEATSMFTVDSNIGFTAWACLPNRAH